MKVEICGVNTSKLPVLSEEKKSELLDKIKAGDTDARELFIKSNLRLVLSVVHKFNNTSENLDDIIKSQSLIVPSMAITNKKPAPLI